MVESLFKFVAPLMKDQSDTIPYEDLVESDREQFAVEQRLVGRLISLIRHGTLQAVVQHHLHCWHSKKKTTDRVATCVLYVVSCIVSSSLNVL